MRSQGPARGVGGGCFLKVPITNGPEKLYVIVYITEQSFDRFVGNISKQNKVYWSPSSETQGQIVGARERLNGAEKNGAKKSAIFSARLVFPLPPLSAPESPRMTGP